MPAFAIPQTHSHVIVPLICAALGVPHSAIPALRIKYGLRTFDGAVHEIQSVLPSVGPPLHVVHREHNPYIHADDQDMVIEQLYLTYGGRSHFQSIQTEVATSEAGTVVSASRFPKGTDSDTGFHPPATISSGERTAKEACCDAPGDITCKTSGMPHNAICTVCHMVMKKKQPFCSKRTGGALCSAGRVGVTPPPSPFKKVEGSKEYGDCPPPKVMKFDDADNKGTPEG